MAKLYPNGLAFYPRSRVFIGLCALNEKETSPRNKKINGWNALFMVQLS